MNNIIAIYFFNIRKERIYLQIVHFLIIKNHQIHKETLQFIHQKEELKNLIKLVY